MQTPGSIVFSGRARGECLRSVLHLDAIDARDNSKGGGLVNVIVPKDVVALNTSFFLGMFGPSIRALGEEEFRKRYSFQCADTVRDDVNQGILYALRNDSNPLQVRDFRDRLDVKPEDRAAFDQNLRFRCAEFVNSIESAKYLKIKLTPSTEAGHEVTDLWLQTMVDGPVWVEEQAKAFDFVRKDAMSLLVDLVVLQPAWAGRLEVVESKMQIMDLDKIAWDAICQAASENTWMPPEYMRNDWLEDVCAFLRTGHVIPPRTEQEIVNQTNQLAREFYAKRGYQVPDGYRFDEATHPHEVEAWEMACMAQRLLTSTDPVDALDNLED